MMILRKLIAITLLVVFSLPFASALLALSPKSEASLPACCRRDGKHHCAQMMAAANTMQSDTAKFSGPLEKCPYCPSALLAQHGQNILSGPSAQIVFARFETQAVTFAQNESKRRISRDRSRQKRGPPSQLFPLS